MAASPVPRSPPFDTGRRRRVLFADDDEWVRESGALILEDLGFSVVAVEDGVAAQKAFEQARATGEAFDVAVLDVRMPRRNGTEIVPHLLATDPRILILLSSGFEREFLDKSLFSSGRVGFVGKPATPEQILEQLQALEAAVRGPAT